MPRTWDNVGHEFNLVVEAVKHFAGVERVETFEHIEKPNCYKIVVHFRNQKTIAVTVTNARGSLDYRTLWRKLESGKHA